MSISKEIGRRIRQLREDQNFTQAGMADELELTPGAYAKIERGETDPQITRLYKIAEVLDVSIYSLLEDDLTKSALKDPDTNAAELVKLSKKVELMAEQLEKLTVNPKTVSLKKVTAKKVTAKKSGKKK